MSKSDTISDRKIVKLESLLTEYQSEVKELKEENKDLKKKLNDLEKLVKQKDKETKNNEKKIEKLTEDKEKIESYEKIVKNIGNIASQVIKPKSCIYLFRLGSVQDLQTVFKIPSGFGDKSLKIPSGFGDKSLRIPKESGSFIYKFGLTNDIDRRESEHRTKFVNKGVKNFERVYIKPTGVFSTREYENKIFDYFRDNEYTFIKDELKSSDKYNELVVINNTDLKKVINFFSKL